LPFQLRSELLLLLVDICQITGVIDERIRAAFLKPRVLLFQTVELAMSGDDAKHFVGPIKKRAPPSCSVCALLQPLIFPMGAMKKLKNIETPYRFSLRKEVRHD
jgi:hypothetical protein